MELFSRIIGFVPKVSNSSVLFLCLRIEDSSPRLPKSHLISIVFKTSLLFLVQKSKVNFNGEENGPRTTCTVGEMAHVGQETS